MTSVTARFDEKQQANLTLGVNGKGSLNLPKLEPYGEFDLLIERFLSNELQITQRGTSPISAMYIHPNPNPRSEYINRPRNFIRTIGFLYPGKTLVIPGNSFHFFVCFTAVLEYEKFPSTVTVQIVRKGDFEVAVTTRFPFMG